MEMSESKKLFLGVEPDVTCYQHIIEYKELVYNKIGHQRFLDDTPHVTLYLAQFDNESQVIERLECVSGQIKAIEAAITNWHVFYNDPLTNEHTIVCDFNISSQMALKQLQIQLIQSIAPLRNVSDTTSGYLGQWARMNEIQRNNIDSYGFPFIGDIWHPHMTIASVKPEQFDNVWPTLNTSTPNASMRFNKIYLFEVHKGAIEKIGAFNLAKQTLESGIVVS